MGLPRLDSLILDVSWFDLKPDRPADRRLRISSPRVCGQSRHAPLSRACSEMLLLHSWKVVYSPRKWIERNWVDLTGKTFEQAITDGRAKPVVNVIYQGVFDGHRAFFTRFLTCFMQAARSVSMLYFLLIGTN